MQGSSVPFDALFQIAKIVSSGLTEAAAGAKRPVQFQLAGVPELDLSADDDESVMDTDTGELDDEDAWGQLGVTVRPLPPDTEGEFSEHAEAVCIRTADGLLPIAARDVRLRMFGDAPNEGTVALLGYGGGYHSISPVDNDDLTKGAIQTIYVPYDFNSDGVAQKAHSITLDPTNGNDAIMIVHAEGMAITMSGQGDKEMILKNAAGDAYLQIDDNGITLNGNVVCNGSLIVGNPALAVPLLAGVASPPSTLFYVSP